MTFVPFPAGAKIRRSLYDSYWVKLCRNKGWKVDRIFTVKKVDRVTFLTVEEDPTCFIATNFCLVSNKTLKDFESWL